MMLFLIEQKTMEIGIRKTFGAGNLQIQSLLYRQYLGLSLFGIGIGGSAAYWVCSKWLENFAYHLELQAGQIVIAGALCLLLGWLSISILGFRAGQINPVEVMKE
jgi:putative ABC transport system permease protein